MRLYLSSIDVGNHADRLVSLARTGRDAGIIVNALDNFPRARKEWLAYQSETLQGLGFVPEELDLRKYFADPQRLAAVLAGKQLLWVNGGNAFLLRRAMRQSGFDAAVLPLVASDELVYGGFSAGACCAAPTLRGVEFVDDPGAVSPGYISEVVWDGLRLVDYSIGVHCGRKDAQGDAIERTIEYWKARNMPYVALRDGEVLVVDGEESEVVK